MALSPEDKKDVKGAFGKAIANKVSKATRDSINSRIELNRQASGGGDVGRTPHKYKNTNDETGVRVPGGTGRIHPLQKMLMERERNKK